MMQAAPSGKKTGLIVAAIIVILAAAALVWWQSAPKPEAGTATVQSDVTDTPQAIDTSLQNIDVGNIEQEFQAIDKDMKAL